jgi:hypothetical protein
MNDEAVGECDEPCRNLDARNAVAEMVEIVAHRENGIGGDPVRRQEIRVPGRVDAELEDHRRRSRTLEGDVEARFDQHGALLALARSTARDGNMECMRILAPASESLMAPRLRDYESKVPGPGDAGR